jgi:hypothetical protein
MRCMSFKTPKAAIQIGDVKTTIGSTGRTIAEAVHSECFENDGRGRFGIRGTHLYHSPPIVELTDGTTIVVTLAIRGPSCPDLLWTCRRPALQPGSASVGLWQGCLTATGGNRSAAKCQFTRLLIVPEPPALARELADRPSA